MLNIQAVFAFSYAILISSLDFQSSFHLLTKACAFTLSKVSCSDVLLKSNKFIFMVYYYKNYQNHHHLLFV